MASDHFDPGHLFGHVQDATYFEVPRVFVSPREEGEASAAPGRIEIPQLRTSREPIFQLRTGVAKVDEIVAPVNLQLTKFMVLEVVAAVLLVLVFVRLANRLSQANRARGRWSNMLETILLFIRDQVARPAIGHHDADRFLPFLWTIFFFVLTCNLLGMVPWLGSPTGALATTAALAFMTFLAVVVAGSQKLGFLGFWKSQVPHMDVPAPIAILLKPMLFVIEVVGLLIKHFVLAVRLLANMMAGHLVLAAVLAFIGVAGSMATSYFSPMFVGISAASILGATALSLLELFVAFLQAYIFTFLSALFIGTAVHPH